MANSVGSVNLEHFRGLPKTKFELEGKNLVILGSNGKGKSGLVDGIEFLFSGQVSRFVGTGTGGINHDDALRHIQRGGLTKVAIALSPSRASFSRQLGTDGLSVCNRLEGRNYIEGHPRVGSFILRRDKILEFINDQASDRYKKFVQLLGLSELDRLQVSFIAAEKESSSNAKSLAGSLQQRLSIFSEVGITAPRNTGDILKRISELATELGFDKALDWERLPFLIDFLTSKRPEANKEEIDALTKASVALERQQTKDLELAAAKLTQASEALTAIALRTADSSKYQIIDEGLSFFHSHGEETQCPLCEQALPSPVQTLVDRLGTRKIALNELEEAQNRKKAATTSTKACIDEIISLIRSDLNQEKVLSDEVSTSLNAALSDAENLLISLNRGDLPIIPSSLIHLKPLRSSCLAELNVRRQKLATPDTSKLESVISLALRANSSRGEIDEAERQFNLSTKVEIYAKSANTAFKRSRELAIEEVFKSISETVLSFYRKLHDWETGAENSECANLELKPDSRAAGGGLKLAIQFIEVPGKDPRGYLSEGHLDSLGLCLFLATVKIFNPPGSMLVLDDVLTSIDKDHRHRVGELLLEEFSEYQILLTTHDEFWWEHIKSLTNARGARNKWNFTKVEGWSLERGPSFSVSKDSWTFIDSNLNESSYREIGGPLRLVLEDFLKRTATKIETKVRFKFDGKYTSGDFYIAGIHNSIRTKLIALSPQEQAAIETAIGRVFGSGDLINFLSHDNPGRLEITLAQTSDFVSGLRYLIEICTQHNLMRTQ